MEEKTSLFGVRSLLFSLLALCLGIALFEVTYLDLYLQDPFFNQAEEAWLIEGRIELLHQLFYKLPKVLIVLTALVLLCFACLPYRCRPAWFPRWKRQDLLVVVLTLGLAPLVVSVIKQSTNIHYPCNIEHYGGTVPYVRLFEHFPEGKRPPQRSAGFPGGHASGGFALMSLAGLVRTRKGRMAGLAIGLSAGWLMGVYQQMRGVHYFSHTLVSMLICWIVFLLLRMGVYALLRRFPPKHFSTRQKA